MSSKNTIHIPVETLGLDTAGHAIMARGRPEHHSSLGNTFFAPRALEGMMRNFGETDEFDEKIFKRLSRASVLKDSTRGAGIMAEADMLKQRGNQALTDKNPGMAMNFYSQALEIALDVKDNRVQLSVLFSNMSYTSVQMGERVPAHKCAFHCTNIRPEWYKSHLRMLEACMWDGIYMQATGVSAGLCNHSDVPSDTERSKIYGYYLKSASHIPGGKKLIMNSTAPLPIWRSAVSSLCVSREWHTLRMLFGVDVDGAVSMPPIVPQQAACDVSLWRVLEACSTKDRTRWVEQLVMALLIRGADYESVTNDGKLPLHAIVQHAVTTDSILLLTEVLKKMPEHKTQMTDDLGNNALHIACRNEFSKRARVIQLLVKHGVSRNQKNNEGKTPNDMLPNEDQGHDPERVFPSESSPSFPESPLPSVTSWTGDDVQRWLCENGLGMVKDRFRDLNGQHLTELQTVQTEAPKFFLDTVQNQLSLTFSQILKLSDSLRKLPK